MPGVSQRICIVDTSLVAGALACHQEALMRGTVTEWGNSAAVRIPIAVMKEARLSIDQAVDVRAERGRIIIAPVQEINPEELLAGITDENLHDEVSFGMQLGKEAH